MAIYQDFLDRTSDALVSGDAEGFLRHVHLRHQIVTENGIIEVADMTAALKHFDGFFGALRAAGADSYVRTAQSAEFVSPDRIIGRHIAHITAGGKLVTPAYRERNGDREARRRLGYVMGPPPVCMPWAGPTSCPGRRTNDATGIGYLPDLSRRRFAHDHVGGLRRRRAQHGLSPDDGNRGRGHVVCCT